MLACDADAELNSAGYEKAGKTTKYKQAVIQWKYSCFLKPLRELKISLRNEGKIRETSFGLLYQECWKIEGLRDPKCDFSWGSLFGHLQTMIFKYMTCMSH